MSPGLTFCAGLTATGAHHGGSVVDRVRVSNFPVPVSLELIQFIHSYQPVSHTIQSKRGSRAQFKSMVETCNAAGVGVIVDAVLNRELVPVFLSIKNPNSPMLPMLDSTPHLELASSSVSAFDCELTWKITVTGGGGSTGVAGSSYTHYDYPTVPYTSDNFHSACDVDSGFAVAPGPMWHKLSYIIAAMRPVSGFASSTVLPTSGPRPTRFEPSVRRSASRRGPEWRCGLLTISLFTSVETAYLADLMSLGVVGFRLDAARSMDPTDIAAFLAPLSTAPFIVQECYGGSPVLPNLYTGNGKVMYFAAGDALKTAFVDGGGLSALLSWPESDWVASDDSNVFLV
mgnify:CR=1 FL=1